MAHSSRGQRRARNAERPVENDGSRQPLPKTSIRPETKHGVVIVMFLTLAAITALSVFNGAGALGNAINQGLGTMFGWQRYAIWIYLLLIGVILLFPEKFKVTASQWTGFVISAIATSAVMQLFLPHQESMRRAINGQGGGYIGALLDYPIRQGLGAWAGGLVLVAILVIGLLIMFNTTLQSLARRGNLLAQILRWIKHLWWRRQLAQASANDDQAAESEDPKFTKQEIETVEEPVTNDEAAPTEKPYVPVPPKPMRREKRQINIPIDLLDVSHGQPTSVNIEVNKEKIRKTLETFGIMVEMGEVNVGPTVTQFTLKPAEGVRLTQISSLQNDLALALAAHPIRIEAPIPGKSLVGIEVPNQSVAIVNLREILDSNSFKQRKSNLTFSLGKDVSGAPLTSDLDPLPHLLVAGATGSGKSVMINGIILSLLYSNSPDDLKLILVDPKRVELSLYNEIPHLLTPVITDTTKTINALRWVVSEMDRRYTVLQNARQRNIASYRKEVGDDMPYIVLVVDELAHLMSVAAKEVEGAIVRLAQMSRAVGIHLVLATQRPSVDVITGLIKANVTARIAFSVASQIDSRTILDTSGAEKLLGKGDMLYISAELSKPKRLQGAFVSSKEVERVTQFLKARGRPDYMEDIVEKSAPVIGGSMEDLGDDELLSQAKEVIAQAGKASASLLQRRLRIGYARAARILDLLEERGLIGPGDGAKPREVYTDQLASQSASSITNEEPITSAEEAEVDQPEAEVEQSDGHNPDEPV